MTTATETMTKPQLKQMISNFLKKKDTGALGTQGEEMRVSPVKYFTDDDLNIYIHSDGGSKFQNIEKDEDVCLLVSTEFYGDLKTIKGVQVFGNATVSHPGNPLYEQAEELCPWEHPTDVKLIKITPNKIVYKDGVDSDGAKQLWERK